MSAIVEGVLEKASDGLSVTQAAAKIGVTPQTVRDWIRSGLLPATKFGLKLIRIDPADLDRMRRPAGPEDVDETA